jgi:heme A synthase
MQVTFPGDCGEHYVMLDTIIELHYLNLFLILTLGLVTSIWGFILYFTKKTINRPWRTALIITAADALLQGIFGVTLLLMGQKPGTGTDLYYLHYVYGGIVALAIPVALTYATGGKKPRRDVLIFSIAALILFAAAFRAWMTGPVHWP